jgi:hypothetical protein
MFKNIIGQGVFQLVVNFSLLYRGPEIFGVVGESTHHLTLFFNTFVMCQVKRREFSSFFSYWPLSEIYQRLTH